MRHETLEKLEGPKEITHILSYKCPYCDNIYESKNDSENCRDECYYQDID